MHPLLVLEQRLLNSILACVKAKSSPQYQHMSPTDTSFLQWGQQLDTMPPPAFFGCVGDLARLFLHAFSGKGRVLGQHYSSSAARAGSSARGGAHVGRQPTTTISNLMVQLVLKAAVAGLHPSLLLLAKLLAVRVVNHGNSSTSGAEREAGSFQAAYLH